MFGFHVDFADVFADDAEGEHDESADEPDRDHHGPPSCDGVAEPERDEHVDEHADGHEDGQEPGAGDEAQRFRGERGDALDREGDHLLQRVFGFAGLAFAALVVDLAGPVAERGHDAAQEQVDLVVFAERVERLAAHEPVVGVGHGLGAHPFEHLVEGFGGGALEPGVLPARGAHADHPCCAGGLNGVSSRIGCDERGATADSSMLIHQYLHLK